MHHRGRGGIVVVARSRRVWRSTWPFRRRLNPSCRCRQGRSPIAGAAPGPKTLRRRAFFSSMVLPAQEKRICCTRSLTPLVVADGPLSCGTAGSSPLPSNRAPARRTLRWRRRPGPRDGRPVRGGCPLADERGGVGRYRACHEAARTLIARRRHRPWGPRKTEDGCAARKLQVVKNYSRSLIAGNV